MIKASPASIHSWDHQGLQSRRGSNNEAPEINLPFASTQHFALAKRELLRVALSRSL